MGSSLLFLALLAYTTPTTATVSSPSNTHIPKDNLLHTCCLPAPHCTNDSPHVLHPLPNTHTHTHTHPQAGPSSTPRTSGLAPSALAPPRPGPRSTRPSLNPSSRLRGVVSYCVSRKSFTSVYRPHNTTSKPLHHHTMLCPAHDAIMCGKCLVPRLPLVPSPPITPPHSPPLRSLPRSTTNGTQKRRGRGARVRRKRTCSSWTWPPLCVLYSRGPRPPLPQRWDRTNCRTTARPTAGR